MQKVLLAILLMLPIAALSQQPAQKNGLVQGFKHPPLEARPMGLWDWTNGNFSLSQITKEMKEAKEKGMGGFDIWDVGTFVDEKKIVPAGPAFMSDQSVQAIGFAVREAERIGLRLGLITASSWNAGGSWVKPEHGAMGLYQSSITITGPQQFTGTLPFPELPKTYGGKTLLIEKGSDGLPTVYEEVALLAIPANQTEVKFNQVVQINSKIDRNGKFSWNVPSGEWQVIRYVYAPTGQPLMVPSPNSTGRMIDHFSAEATEMHVNFFINKLQRELGTLKNRALKYLYEDSYEVNTAIWTPTLVKEFDKRTGYSMIPYLPVLDGKVVQSKDISERFLFDYKKLLSDLIIENHYRKTTEICKKYGLDFIAEAGGPGPPVHNVPFEDLKALGALSVPRGEFWNRHPRGEKHTNELQIVKGIASAAHLYNQKYVEAESFTSVWVWQEGPQELKPIADRAFCEGLNRIVYHTFPHTPEEAGSPGWVYNFGTLIHVNNSWWEKSRSFHGYLARTSYLLQQGNFVGDVAFYYGDKAPNFVQYKQLHPSLGFGYDYDVVNSESILKFMSVRNGRIYLPHGQFYEVLVLPDEETINLEVLKKLEQMVMAGATVIGRKPTKTYGLHQYQQKEKEIQEISNRMWGKCDSVTVKENKYGKGKIVWGKTIRQVLNEKGITQDFGFSAANDTAMLDYIHRSTGKEEIYFVRNVQNARHEVKLSFRVTGKTPRLWNPADSSIYGFQSVKKGVNETTIALRMEPYESFFIIFDNTALSVPLTEKELKPVKEKQIEGSWEVRYPHGWGAPVSTTFDNLASWTEARDAGIQHFSGIATYHKTIELSKDDIRSGKRIFLDLGNVREVADVWINGHHLGERCFLPYSYDVSKHVKEGTNYLVIQVANTLNNRMVGDATVPEPYKRTKSNIIKGPTPWTKPWAEVPLIKSGLLGPVKLISY